MRSYSRERFIAARDAWADGDFDEEWDEFRRISWERGFPEPPNGTKDDDRDADQPSQRAIVYRAMNDNPTETLRIVSQSGSWSQVVWKIMGTEERIREDSLLAEKEADYDRAERPTHREAAMTLASIINRIRDSS